MKRTVLWIMLIALLQAAAPPSADPTGPCGNSLSPPFVASGTKPNILIILDNSNSMDEDFYGNAAGSYAPASKSVVAKQALRTVVTELQSKANVGIMTYTLPSSGVSSYNIHNYLPFSSYNPNSYCANPPDACTTYCISEDSTAKDECEAGCLGLTTTDFSSGGSAKFPDKLISSYSTNNATRERYCRLIYPKTQRMVNPSDPSHYIYWKQADPLYSSSNLGTRFAYSGSDAGSSYSYSYAENASNRYKGCTGKTGTSDVWDGYSGSCNDYAFSPTDSDYALGFYNFGQRTPWYYVGPTWFSNTATSGGYVKVAVGDLSNSTQYNSVYNMLDPKSGDSTGYMSCTASNKNTCSYIVDAALTPTAGTLKSAYDYFNGNYSGQSSPINLKCQKNYVIYVTDGLPSTKLNGQTTTDITTLMPEVITQLTNLKTGVTKRISNKDYTFPIKTYVLGMALSSQAKVNLDQMAVAGGTQTSTGHAYYADDASQLTDALQTIVSDLLARVAAGSSISILSEGQTQMGANILQGVFYPSKYFGTTNINWPGYLYNYWFYNSRTLNNIREDTNHDYILDLDEDYGLTFAFDDQNGMSVNRSSDPTGGGDPNQFVDNVDLDGVNPLWEAGKKLFNTTASSRQIYTVGSTGSLVNFDGSNTSLTSSGSLLGSTTNMDACITGATDTAKYQSLIDYVRGVDLTNCRKRTVGLCSSATDTSTTPCNSSSDCTAPYSTCVANVWKLGDIVYSTPKVQTDYKYCSDGTNFNSTHCASDADCGGSYATCTKKESVAYVGANDGMLHAIKTGILTNQGLDATSHQVEKFTGIANSESGRELWAFIPKNSLPYLRCLAIPPPNSCHLYYSDLSPHIVKMTSGTTTKTVLIGGMRMGGAAADNIGGYCFSAAGISNAQTCTRASDCATPPYNASCSTAYHFTAPTDTCTPVQCPDPTTCYNPSACTGLSSYYALDITDAENPQLLWEFSHPMLGYSYSGPAIIHKWSDPATKTGDRYYVMFSSGPTNPTTGSSIQNVKSLVLSLDSTLKIGGVYVNDFGNPTKNGFGGRLYSNGLDMNDDGFTDFVLFGYGYSASGNTGDWKGGIAKINTNNTEATLALDPANWGYDVTTYSNIAQLPITAKVETMKCFDTWYIFSGTGRYFFPLDDYGPPGASGKNYIFGAPFLCDQYGQGCGNLNSLNDNRAACTNLQKGPSFLEQAGWLYTLDDAEGTYLRERMVTDPSKTANNIIYFVTAEPTGDTCGYGGRSRVWGMNCATGSSIIDTSCTGYTISTGNVSGTLFLQTSTGAIYKINPSSSFTDSTTGNRTTGWMVGMPPENAAPVVPPASTPKNGAVIQWMEK